MTTTPTLPSETTSHPQVAVNDIGSAEDFLAAIDETIKYFNDGDIVEGTIVKVDRDEVLLDIGYKTEGVIPSRELSIKHDIDPNEVVEVGDKVEALVLQKEDKEGRLILSKKRAQYERAWGTIEQVKEEDGVVEGTVIEVVKGGLILDIGLRGFLPASLVEMRRVRDLQPYVGQTLEAKIIELDKNRNNVVLSRRAWLEQTQSEVRHGFLTQLQKGQIRKGVVSSIVNFGAFVDLGGVDGLVHVSELSWKHIDHPSEVVTVGDEVTVEVLDVDMERERVSLSLKATQEDPWQHFARTHQIGQIVPGKVTKLVPFGSFVRVEEGIEGLVHISELAERHVEIPEQVVQVNDDVMVKIIDIDLERRRISLSLKQANETATAAEVEEFDPTLYGMSATYDDQGNYIYPDGFDPDTGEWLEGFDEQRKLWEDQYAKAHARWEAHVKQQAEAQQAEVEAGEATSYSSEAEAPQTSETDRRLTRFRRGAAGAPREAHRRQRLSNASRHRRARSHVGRAPSGPDALRSALIGTPYRTGVAILVALTLALRAYSVSRWTWTDDDWIFLYQTESMGLGAYLFQNHHGHVAPLSLLVTLVLTKLFPLSHTAVVVVTAFLAATAVWVWAAAFKELFGERLRLLGPLALIALTPLAVRPTVWWAAAMLHLPLQVAMGAGVLFAARYARRPGTAGLVRIVLVMVGGLLCNEKSLLIVAPILATVLFCSRAGILATVRRTWPLMVVLSVTVTAYLAAYTFAVESSGLKENVSVGAERRPSPAVALDFFVEGLGSTLTPAAFGGPWGTTPVIGEPLAAPSTWVQLLTAVVLLVATLIGLLVRRGAWIPVTLAGGYTLVALMLVLFSNRYQLFGDIAIHDERYTLDVLVVWALACAMLTTPLRDEPPSLAFRRPTPEWWRVRQSGLVVGMALGMSLLVGNVQVISRIGTHPAEEWVQNLLADVDRRAPVPLYDAHPAARFLPPPGRDGVLSRMLAPLGDKVSFGGPAETLLLPDETGRLRPAEIEPSVSAEPGPVERCGYAVQVGRPVQDPTRRRALRLRVGDAGHGVRRHTERAGGQGGRGALPDSGERGIRTPPGRRRGRDQGRGGRRALRVATGVRDRAGLRQGGRAVEVANRLAPITPAARAC